MKYIIDDNFASQDLIKEVYDAFLDIPKDPSVGPWVYWVWLPYTSSPKLHKSAIAKNSNTEEDMLLVTSIEPNLPYYDLTQKLLKTFAKKHGLSVNQTIRTKVNLYFKSDNNSHHTPHIDFEQPHWVFLYFLNDSDGETVFFENKEGKEYIRVEPKAGRAVVFDGSIYHASQSPKHHKLRSTLNINFI